jgi:hypothetical protein
MSVLAPRHYRARSGGYRQSGSFFRSPFPSIVREVWSDAGQAATCNTDCSTLLQARRFPVQLHITNHWKTSDRRQMRTTDLQKLAKCLVTGEEAGCEVFWGIFVEFVR